MYDLAFTYFYRNGSSFTEHFAKPQTVRQLADKIEKARAKYAQESNIVKIKSHIRKVDTAE